jgi:hypothetical protein
MRNVRIYRHLLNFWPCIFGTGAHVAHLSPDFREMDIHLPLTWRTRNKVGTTFGGSIYASTDPFYMVMLMEILGPDFVVWDKGATLRFKRPAKRTLYARLRLSKEFTDSIREKVLADGEMTFEIPVSYRDSEGAEYAEIKKMLYVARKDFYARKLENRKQKEG